MKHRMMEVELNGYSSAAEEGKPASPGFKDNDGRGIE